MRPNGLASPGGVSLSRRRFVLGLTAGGVLAGLGPTGGILRADAGQTPSPSGGEFDLTIAPQPVNFTGSPAVATTVNGSLPAPTLRWREGERVTLRVTNLLPEDSSIHWHGIVVPTAMDGVPGFSFPGIRPGETFVYHFDVRQSGTFWYHSHSGFQEQTGLYGAIVIAPREGETIAAERDYVVLLSDWTDENPMTVYAKLKKLSHYYNRNERSAADLLRELREKGLPAVLAERGMWQRMRMSDRDLSDVTGSTYTFLMNGRPPSEGWTGLFRRGERVRLRLINAAAMTFFDFRIPGLEMTVVAADGQEIEPVTVEEIRLGVAETYDVLVRPRDDRAYALFAQAIDRSGFALGTLTPDLSLRSPVPAMDPPPVLTHADMDMDMGHGGGDAAPAGHAGMVMEHSGHAMGGQEQAAPAPAMGSGGAGFGSGRPLRHASTEYGPGVDMRVASPRHRLDDPGPGLRGNGRRVLTYADLRNRRHTHDPREPGREIELHLTGSMRRYMWSFDGVPYEQAEPLRLRLGERLRITLVNDTMMHHPIHLHGIWSELETGDPQRIPRKHTVTVPPGARLSYLVSADAPGRWAYHCHLLYHMLGMFREVTVA